MAGPIRIEGTATLGNSIIANENVSASAAIDATKLTHRHKAGSDFGLDSDATPTAQTKTVFTAKAAATVKSFHCLLTDTGTSTDVDFNLLKNDTTILSSVVNITHASSDRQVSDGTLSSTGLVAGDVLTIDLAVTSSTGAQGPFAWVEVDEVAT